MQLWLRKVRVRFFGAGGELYVNQGASTSRQIYVDFNIEKSISGKANDASIRIYNLNESSRNSIGNEFTDVEIEAGYIPNGGPDNTGVIFSGQVRDFEHVREGSDIITSVNAGDGDKAIRKSTISKTYPAGSTAEEVMLDIFSEFSKNGVKQGEWVFPPMEPFIRPYTICGPAAREANILGRGRGFYWNIQNQVMEIIPRDFNLPLITPVNKKTGMIGYPKITDNGLRVDSLINPEIRPNRLIMVESEVVDLNADNGEYRVGRCDYRGDNKKGPFNMTIHAESKKGGVIDEGVL